MWICTNTEAKRLSRPAVNLGSRASHMKVGDPASHSCVTLNQCCLVVDGDIAYWKSGG
jgi:hypothetical protein